MVIKAQVKNRILLKKIKMIKKNILKKSLKKILILKKTLSTIMKNKDSQNHFLLTANCIIGIKLTLFALMVI